MISKLTLLKKKKNPQAALFSMIWHLTMNNFLFEVTRIVQSNQFSFLFNVSNRTL